MGYDIRIGGLLVRKDGTQLIPLEDEIGAPILTGDSDYADCNYMYLSYDWGRELASDLGLHAMLYGLDGFIRQHGAGLKHVFQLTPAHLETAKQGLADYKARVSELLALAADDEAKEDIQTTAEWGGRFVWLVEWAITNYDSASIWFC